MIELYRAPAGCQPRHLPSPPIKETAWTTGGWVPWIPTPLASGLFALCGVYFDSHLRRDETQAAHWRVQRRAAYATLLASLSEQVERLNRTLDDLIITGLLPDGEQEVLTAAARERLTRPSETRGLEAATAQVRVVAGLEVMDLAACARLALVAFEDAVRRRSHIIIEGPDDMTPIAYDPDGNPRATSNEGLQLRQEAARDAIRDLRDAIRIDLGTPPGFIE